MGFAMWLPCFGLALAAEAMQLSNGIHQHVSKAPEEYYYSSRSRGPSTNNFSPYTATRDFSKGATWVWQNELNEQVRHSPLIDAEFNIYVCTTKKLRKFSPNGNLLWTWHAPPETVMSASPALYNGSIYVLPCQGKLPTAVSIDMNSGVVNWKRTYNSFTHNADAEAVLVYKGKMVFGALTNLQSGTDTAVAVSASTGDLLWKYVADEIMWNFSPSTPGDGTLLFSSMCGAVFRVGPEGKLMWKAGKSHQGHSCVPAGGALGPNGMFYSEYNEGGGADGQSVGTINNTLAAYNITDGSLVWTKSLPYRAAQYPAVGKLGPDGPLAVVAAMGDNPQRPMSPAKESMLLARNGGTMRNLVMAVDASTGATLWVSEDNPFPHIVGAGDSDKHDVGETACWPDAQGIPLISGDGTVYTSSSHHGDLRALKDSDNDGVISPWEVSTFKTGKCFLNSPSIAPGMLVAAPCWGPMYVFSF